METYNLSGRVILFTGATSGLGKIAALKAASQGARVIVTYRDFPKAELLRSEFVQKNHGSNGTIDLIECDLTSLKSIRAACGKVKEGFDRLDILVNNAGTWNFGFYETVDGIENTLQTNLLAPKLIIDELIDLLSKSDNPKVINTASALHKGTINFGNIEFRKGFSGFRAYRQSKLGIILLTRLYHKIYGIRGIHFYSQHPGLVDTGLVRKGGRVSKLFFKIFGKTPEQGAQTLIHLLLASPKELVDGEYHKNKKPSKTDTKESYNLQLAEKLNEVCEAYLRR